MEDENILDFNFWPSFSDLMLSVVLILILTLFIVSAVLNVGTINLSHVQTNQQEIIDSIATELGEEPTLQDQKENLYVITTTDNGNEGDIYIKNEPTFQKITFSSNVLFPPDMIELNNRGRKALQSVGKILKQNIGKIREIQIQGHADPTPTQFQSNLHLASMRAISVFNFLKDDLQIDPANHLMSISSYGEYKPVQRTGDEKHYSQQILTWHNYSTKKKERNRRIELLVFYRYQ